MTIKPGALRFNTDSMKLEIFRGSANYEGTASMAGIGTLAAGQWEEIQATSPEAQTGGARGLFVGGRTGGSARSVMDYVNIDSTGNSINFGNLTAATRTPFTCASRTRGISAGGITSGYVDDIITITIASTGSAVDSGFGLSQSNYNGQSGSNSTRGIFAGGDAGGTNTDRIEYITIASVGTGVVFGNLSSARQPGAGGVFSSTRGIFAGGSPGTNTIEFVTISTLGNAADFGDLLASTTGLSPCSNSTRGLFSGFAPSATNRIDYVTISTLGNAQDFGDLTNTYNNTASCASATRGLWAGGYVGPSLQNVIQYVQITSLGNAVDFGDLVNGGNFEFSGLSNGHGGL